MKILFAIVAIAAILTAVACSNAEKSATTAMDSINKMSIKIISMDRVNKSKME